MKVLFAILAASLGVAACSARQLSADRDAGVGGTNDAARSDVGGQEAGASDAGTVDVSVARQPLCDGVQHLRLAAAFVGGGQDVRGARVRTENGYPLFAVDGTCTYWLGGGWAYEILGGDRPVRTGKLSDADARTLGELLPLDDIGALAGNCSPDSFPDAPARSIRTATGGATCGPGTPAFEAAWKAVQAIAARLAAEGSVVDGPLHVSAVGSSAGASARPYAWPSGLALDPFILDGGDENAAGVSRLVDDPDAAEQLRALRDRYLADVTARPNVPAGDGLLASDQSRMVYVYMRDAIPYEDARGLLKF